jgi:uncharacterized protein (DUF427 family)
MSANSGPRYKQRPDHRLTTKSAGVRVQVKLDGELIADTRDAVEMKEGDYPVVFVRRKSPRRFRYLPTQ